ncbi:hypothetical protein T492DRAFT_1086280 [Pavlovales sp. CCMP2436]|nr:hypothetical protein T492DRAFT_1086280 [Pavlovales sp. CCMP2436]
MGGDVQSYQQGLARLAALAGGSEWALLLVDEMAALGVPPDAACFSSALAAAIGGGEPAAVDELLGRAEASGVRLDPADTCAAISAVHALSTSADAFTASHAGRMWSWREEVLPSLSGDNGGPISLCGLSGELAAQAACEVLERLLSRQLAAGPLAFSVRGALRFRFGAAPLAHVLPGRGARVPADEAEGVDPVLLTVERALGSAEGGATAVVVTRERAAADRPTARAARAGGGGGPAAGDASAPVWELVLSQGSVEGWVRARCLARWVADTGRVAAEPARPRGDLAPTPALQRPERAAEILAGGSTHAGDSSVGAVKGVGAVRKAQLESAGLRTVGQLAALVGSDLSAVAAQSEVPAGILAKFVAEARRMMSLSS